MHKDTVPFIQQSMAVYEYVYRCDCRYVGHTSLRLQERISQHIPNFIRRKQQPTNILPEQKCKIRSIVTHQQCGSAIGLHLMQNPECATQYSHDQFSILAKARSMFDLSVLEAAISKSRSQFFVAKKSLFIHFKFFTNRDIACQQWQHCTVSWRTYDF